MVEIVELTTGRFDLIEDGVPTLLDVSLNDAYRAALAVVPPHLIILVIGGKYRLSVKES